MKRVGKDVSDGASVSPASGTAKDFTNAVDYTVTAEDRTITQVWTVTVEPNIETDITAFNIPNQVGASTIDTTNHTVALTMPYGTDVTSLIPTITLSDGASASPTSGTAKDFTNAVNYTVTAENGTTTQLWTVTVTVEPNIETDITAFNIPNQVGTSTINATNHTVIFTMPHATNVTSLTPTITLSGGATVNPTSGTVQDFTNTVNYTVTAQDGTTTQLWTVTVMFAPNTETDITALTIPNQVGTSTIDTTNHTVALTMPYGTHPDNSTKRRRDNKPQ